MLRMEECAFVNMVPVEVIRESIAPHFSVRDLQALDTAFSNKYLRPRWKVMLKSVRYACVAYDKMDFFDMKWLHEHGVTITSLNLSNHGENDAERQEAINYLCTHINSLKQLKLHEAYGGPNTDFILQQLAHSCPLLEVLDIPGAHDINVGIAALGQQCHFLHTISFPISRFSDAGIQAMCDNCPNIKHIEVTASYSLTDSSLLAIANTYPNLHSISMLYCKFTDDGLIYFADKCHELRSVSVRCDNITSRGLTALWAASPTLLHVNISFNDFISDDDIIQLARCCPLLQKLNIACNRITNVAVIAVAEHCPQLRLLDIKSCTEVSDAALIALGQHCHELKSISTFRLRNISDVGIAALAAGCPLLQELLAYDNGITDAGVIALAHGCHDLRKINLSDCKSIGIAAVSAIADNCPLISELHISNCNIDDACLDVIAQHCRNLTYLDISFGKFVEADSIRSVLESCSRLIKVDTSDCIKLRNKESIRNLQQKYPHIRGLLNVFVDSEW